MNQKIVSIKFQSSISPFSSGVSLRDLSSGETDLDLVIRLELSVFPGEALLEEREPEIERLFSEDRNRDRLRDFEDLLSDRERVRLLLDLESDRLRLLETLRDRRLSLEASINLILRPFNSLPSKVSKAFLKSAELEKQTIPSFFRIR
jgi:hypothetical protein